MHAGCQYGPVFFVFSSVGAEKAGESANRDHAAFIRKSLHENKSKWKAIIIINMLMPVQQIVLHI
jgi:hypothetical protein